MREGESFVVVSRSQAELTGGLDNPGCDGVSFFGSTRRAQRQSFRRLRRLVDLDGDGLARSNTGNRDTAIRSDGQLQGSRQG